ncbi:hypothetical protein KOI35_46770 [Actinoplanes bogorensis]|uniref:Uncharacterized protein n=1 Tax=Paractinoplanes bogorensis TaxID=1610840 RepID=A0ABS5Z637_9ACTN|nr:hypothetical protein [Actinoplanes bogorensis]MBU2671026.1 hypothetical protein [Actinoplanes bogorensis]
MTVDETINAAGQEWRRLGVSAQDRRTLAADLRLDLEAAVADGVPADQLIDGDVQVFARRLVEESGVRHVPPRYGTIVATALAGAVVGVLVGALIVAGVHMVMVTLFDLPGDFNVPVAIAAGIYYAGVGLVALAGAVIGVLILLRNVPAIGRTAAAMAWLTPLSAIVVVPLIMLFARTTGYSTAVSIVLTEVALTIAGFVGATVLARRWTLIRGAGSPA